MDEQHSIDMHHSNSFQYGIMRSRINHNRDNIARSMIREENQIWVLMSCSHWAELTHACKRDIPALLFVVNTVFHKLSIIQDCQHCQLRWRCGITNELNQWSVQPIYPISGRSKGDMRDTSPPPPVPNSFNFMQFWGNFGKILDPPLPMTSIFIFTNIICCK